MKHKDWCGDFGIYSPGGAPNLGLGLSQGPAGGLSKSGRFQRPR